MRLLDISRIEIMNQENIRNHVASGPAQTKACREHITGEPTRTIDLRGIR